MCRIYLKVSGPHWTQNIRRWDWTGTAPTLEGWTLQACSSHWGCPLFCRSYPADPPHQLQGKAVGQQAAPQRCTPRSTCLFQSHSLRSPAEVREACIWHTRHLADITKVHVVQADAIWLLIASLPRLWNSTVIYLSKGHAINTAQSGQFLYMA